jgi:nucleotide-binding universal stress UspA family protein
LNFAKQHSAKVVVVDTVRPPSIAATWLTSNAEDMFNIVVADKKKRLDQVAAVFKEAGIEVSVEVLYGKSSEEIARAVLNEDADLVIRYMKGVNSRFESIFGATARNLMRVCPCPILLVGSEPISDPKVLACVNAEHGFNENEAIVKEAEKLAGKPDHLMAMYCWKFYGTEFLSEYLDENTLKNYLNEAEQNYQSVFDNFLTQHDLEAFEKGVRLQNGDPAEVIPEVCRQEEIDVVVMSSASQNHPLKRLLGSTVESVLDELPCALLVVKPIGFTSPIKQTKVQVNDA